MSGQYILPQIKLSYTDENGEQQHKETSEIFVEVISDEKKTDEEDNEADGLRDIKKNHPFEKGYLYSWIVLLGGILLIFLGSYILYIKIKKRRKDEPLPSPREMALSSLEEIKLSEISSQEEGRIFAFSLSDILRDYIEKQFEFPATDRTYEEIRSEGGSSTNVEEQYWTVLLRILESCEKIKYASSLLTIEMAKNLLEQSMIFVEETSKDEVVEAEGGDQEEVI